MIRDLSPDTDLAAVAALMDETADFWTLTEGAPAGPTAAADFFTDGPPNHDPARQRHLGLFVENRLSGIAELSFGFPEASAAYLGLMLLAPRIRGAGHGQTLLAHTETLARTAGATTLYLGVIEANPRGRAFWERHGFRPTGITRTDERNTTHRLMKPL